MDSTPAVRAEGHGVIRSYLRHRVIRQVIPEKSGTKSARLPKDSRADRRPGLDGTRYKAGNTVDRETVKLKAYSDH
ncbi:hypothetical protein [Streptomyces sp. NPDC054783]